VSDPKDLEPYTGIWKCTQCGYVENMPKEEMDTWYYTNRARRVQCPKCGRGWMYPCEMRNWRGELLWAVNCTETYLALRKYFGM